jgi:hypothetical protein
MYRLLKALVRGFRIVNQDRAAPHGTVRWTAYALRKVSTANYLSVPCTFPDLQSDVRLQGSIKYTTQLQRQSLIEQIEAGPFVLSLVDLCDQILLELNNIEAVIPTPREISNWLRSPMSSEAISEGVEAIQWTTDERGLAGASDMSGLPWAMRMDSFFEAWIETLFGVIARRTGGKLKSGRLRQTVRALEWEPAYIGSQKSLIPDIWIEWPNLTAIIDAKYKRHFEELNITSWKEADQQLREQHRHDLLQILAYGALAHTRDVLVCLIYPCQPSTWKSLNERGRLFHRAEISVPNRRVQLWLTAAPIGETQSRIIEQFELQFRSAAWRS